MEEIVLIDDFLQLKFVMKYIVEVNEIFGLEFDYFDCIDFELVQCGLFVMYELMMIWCECDDKVVFDLELFFFFEGEVFDMVNLSFWCQCQFNVQNCGFYEVIDGIYQLCGFDFVNMILVCGEMGWILIDLLICVESLVVVLVLVNEYFGECLVCVVIYIYSYVDYFVGVWGVIMFEQVYLGEVIVLVLCDYVCEVLFENVMVGNVMNCCVIFMFGNLLLLGLQGFVGNGFGFVLLMGIIGFVVLMDMIYEIGEMCIFDGVDIEFQWMFGIEVLIEMVFFFLQFVVLCMLEIVLYYLYNVYMFCGVFICDVFVWVD